MAMIMAFVKTRLPVLLTPALLLAGGVVMAADAMRTQAIAQLMPPSAAPRYRSDQDAARRAMLDGQIMPYALLRRRTDAQVQARYGDGAAFLAPEFIPSRNLYRMKYMHDRRVIWLDIDGRTGEIIGWDGR